LVVVSKSPKRRQIRALMRARASAVASALLGGIVALAGSNTYAGSAASNPRLGLPDIAAPADDPWTPAKAALGRIAFFDKRLSGDGTVSCASCHVPEKGYTDGVPLALGIGGLSGSRKTPSLLNVGLAASFFWDGRRPSLEAQALDPLFNPREHGLTDRAALIRLLRGDPVYRGAFRRAFGAEPGAVTLGHFGQAVASFERTLWAADSPFDRYEYAGDHSALSVAAQRGLSLFRGRAQCSVCHTLGDRSASFSDGQFHSLGVGFDKIAPRLAQTATRVANSAPNELDKLILSDADVAELGRFNVTKQPADIGKFKTPSLRNVALTGPYMHDGSVKTLGEAVETEVYYRSIEANHPLILTPAERSDLVEFLKSLTSPYATTLVVGKSQP
jgi:cytochrome c peroxidase